jgi:hypothetical protein
MFTSSEHGTSYFSKDRRNAIWRGNYQRSSSIGHVNLLKSVISKTLFSYFSHLSPHELLSDNEQLSNKIQYIFTMVNKPSTLVLILAGFLCKFCSLIQIYQDKSLFVNNQKAKNTKPLILTPNNLDNSPNDKYINKNCQQNEKNNARFFVPDTPAAAAAVAVLLAARRAFGRQQDKAKVTFSTQEDSVIIVSGPATGCSRLN